MKSGKRLKSGKWLKVKLAADQMETLTKLGAHVTDDGYLLGVYLPAGIDSLGQRNSEQIVLVNKEGRNLRVPRDSEMVLVAPAPEDCVKILPIAKREDLPAARLATANPNWDPSRSG